MIVVRNAEFETLKGMLTVTYQTGIAQECEEKGKIKGEEFNQKVFIIAVKNTDEHLFSSVSAF